MRMSRRGSPALFAGPQLLLMIICISISIEMGSAWWPNICTSGETYIERNHINRPEKCDSTVCDDWCKGQCWFIGRAVTKKNCQAPSPYLDCQCCCTGPTPPSGSPPPPSLPPNPPSPPPSDGKWYDGALNDQICASGQKYELIKRANIEVCALFPECEKKCKESGLLSAGSQCVGSSRDFNGGSYSWYEQCCCVNPAPPPPSPPPPSPPPSPPPPPPPTPSPPPPPSPSPSPPSCSCCGDCCPVDINIQISVKQGSGQPPKVTL